MTMPAVARESPLSERALIIAFALGSIVIPLSSTMIAVALPRLMSEWGLGAATAGWLVTSYLITMACAQPIAGKLGDRFGRRRLILGGLAGFGLASLGAALAPDMTLLLTFRVLQAVAGAISIPNAVAVVRELIPMERRAGYLGMLGAAQALGAAAGPPLGSLFLATAGWRAIFYINLPFIIPAVVLSARLLPASPVSRRADSRFDVLGAILLLTLLLGLSWLLMHGHRQALPVLLPGGLVVLALGAFFLWRESTHPDPVLQPRLFRHTAFTAANGAMALGNLAMYSTVLTVPVLLSRQEGWRDGQLGIPLVALSASMILGAPLGGRLADRLGRRWPTVAGLSLLSLGAVTLALSNRPFMLPMMLAGLALVGGGFGLAAAGLQAVSVEAVKADSAGVAAGVFLTSRYMGSIVGASVLAGLLEQTREGGEAFGTIFLMIFVAACLALLLGFGLHDFPREPLAEKVHPRTP